MICRFLNPQAAETIFDGKKVEKTESTKDAFEKMAKDLKGKYTPEELEAMMNDPKHFSELDRIEKV